MIIPSPHHAKKHLRNAGFELHHIVPGGAGNRGAWWLSKEDGREWGDRCEFFTDLWVQWLHEVAFTLNQLQASDAFVRAFNDSNSEQREAMIECLKLYREGIPSKSLSFFFFKDQITIDNLPRNWKSRLGKNAIYRYDVSIFHDEVSRRLEL